MPLFHDPQLIRLLLRSFTNPLSVSWRIQRSIQKTKTFWGRALKTNDSMRYMNAVDLRCASTSALARWVKNGFVCVCGKWSQRHLVQRVPPMPRWSKVPQPLWACLLAWYWWFEWILKKLLSEHAIFFEKIDFSGIARFGDLVVRICLLGAKGG